MDGRPKKKKKNRKKVEDAASEPRTETRPIANLKPNPGQDSTITPLTTEERSALKADMTKNGMVHPVEVLPDGTILDGHNRVDIQRERGKTEIRVLVRCDLEHAGVLAQQTRFLEANLNRRQLSKLGKVKIVAKLAEIECGKPITELPTRGLNQVKESIGKRVSLSPRHVSRYLHIARSPLAVQEAFARGEIKLNTASRVAKLSQQVQQEIAERIESGEHGEAVVTEYMPRRRPQRSGVRTLVDAIETATAGLDAAEFRSGRDGYAKALKRCRGLLTRLIRQIESTDTVS